MYTQEYNRAYYEKNKEQMNANSREYHHAHKDEANARSAQYYEDNKDLELVKRRAYYQKNKLIIKAKRAAHYIKNKAKIIERILLRNRSVIEQKCDCCTDEDFMCIYDFASVAGLHVDHIRPISKMGLHCQRNLQLLSPEVNLKKRANWDGVSGVGI